MFDCLCLLVLFVIDCCGGCVLIVVGWLILASDCDCCVVCLLYDVAYCDCLFIVFNILFIALRFMLWLLC